jgi:trigger factor
MKLASKNLEDYLIQNKFEIFGRPIQGANQKPYNFDINNPSDYTFEFEIGTKPAFDIPFLSGSATIPLYKVSVSDSILQEEIEKLQYKAGEMKDPESVTTEDNVLNVVFTECDTDGNAIVGGIQKDNSLLVKYFTQSLQEQLMGKKAGDFILFNLQATFDEKLLPAIMKDLNLDAQDEAARNKNFKLGITKVGLIEKAELNLATFEKIYPGREIETEEKFRETLRSEMEQYWSTQSRTFLHNELFERLVHETPIELPINFLKRFMSIGGEKYVAPEEVEKQFGNFDHQIRWELISSELVQQFGIEVTKTDLETAARMQVMSYFGQHGEMPSMDAEWLDPFIEKQLADKKFRGELENKIITDKLFWAIEQKVNLQETEVSVEEFVKIPVSHHHHH